MPPRKKLKTAHPSSGNTSGERECVLRARHRFNTPTRTVRPSDRGAAHGTRLSLLSCSVSDMSALAQIGGLLHPKDLFSLCHTCKEIRACYWSKGAERCVWQVALKNTPPLRPGKYQDGPLPARPAFLSIPAFVHLLFTTNCTVRPHMSRLRHCTA